jgi:tetratricopeptide (TPR) repeat protein
MAELSTDRSRTIVRAEDFGRQFLAIARKKLTGTLVVTSTNGDTKAFLCHNGTIADIDPGHDDTLLSEIVLGIPDALGKSLKKAQKLAEKNGGSLGAALVELAAVGEDELIPAIERGVTGQVTEVFTWEIAASEFFPHTETETIDGFHGELVTFFDLSGDPESLFLEAAQRLRRWDLVCECHELLRDVFYATPSTFCYFREPETYPTEIRVLGALDGRKDVEEVVDESGLDPFVAIDVLRYLIRDGAIELINPVQLFQLGTEADANGNLEKSSRLYRRAKERGLNDFDVDLRLAQALEKLGKKQAAAGTYFEFGNNCLAQLRVDDAIRSFERVVKLTPNDTVAIHALVDLLIQNQRLDEAFEAAMEYAHRIDADSRVALEVLLRLRGTNFRDIRLHEKVIELAGEIGDTELVREQRELIANAFHDRRDTADALASLQRLFCEGVDSLEVRLKLIDLHTGQGNRQKALEHINYLLNLGGRRRISDVPTLLSLHENARELQPGDVRSNRFLFDYWLTGGDKDRAIAVAKSWVPELERAGDLPELARALGQLIEIDDQPEHRWNLAQVLERQGKRDAARSELQKLAQIAMRAKDFDSAARALEFLLRKSPLDIETRRMQAEYFELRDEKDLAADKIHELATLEIIGGRIQEAEGYCRQYLLSRPDDAEIILKFGNLCAQLGDEQKATEQYLKAAKIQLESRNLGLARAALDRIFRLNSQNPEAKSLLERLEAASEALVRPAPKSLPSVKISPAQSVAAIVTTPTLATSTAKAPSNTQLAAATPGAIRSEKVEGAVPSTRPAGPRVSLSGITARLKNLKTGGPGPRGGGDEVVDGDRSPDRASTSAAESSSTTRAPEASAVHGDPESSPPDGSNSSRRVPTASSALRSAAARLRSLSTKGPSSSENGENGASSVPPTIADLVATRSSGVFGGEAAAKALAPSATRSSGAVATPAESTISTRSDRGGESPTPGSAPPTATVRQKLDGAASRLAALRGGKS